LAKFIVEVIETLAWQNVKIRKMSESGFSGFSGFSGWL
jgi:hypothetical protein